MMEASFMRKWQWLHVIYNGGQANVITGRRPARAASSTGELAGQSTAPIQAIKGLVCCG
jgi:hypothetical protein